MIGYFYLIVITYQNLIYHNIDPVVTLTNNIVQVRNWHFWSTVASISIMFLCFLVSLIFNSDGIRNSIRAKGKLLRWFILGTIARNICYGYLLYMVDSLLITQGKVK